MKQISIYTIIFSVAFFCASHASEDPWSQLRKQYEKKEIAVAREKQDPWKRLRAVFLPFSISEENRAEIDSKAADRFAEKFNSRLLKYDRLIKKASNTFNIPCEIIKAVIMAESGGDNYAKAKTTSAKGLMQTIDSTFSLARKNLEKKGIKIPNDPFNPESSIMAGSWYLDRMYERCIRDNKIGDGTTISNNRNDISSWRYPLEYYYAGPVHGAKEKNRIYVFSNGEKRMIDKRAYSKKIQKWAEILSV